MNGESIAFLAVILAAFVIVVFMGLTERRRFVRRMRVLIDRDYGKHNTREVPPERKEAVSAYFRTHPGKNSIDDITWSDLELDRLFTAMNLTYSAAGEEMLYHMLRTPLYDGEALKRRASYIDYFRTHKEKRENLQMIFSLMGKSDRYSLYDYYEFAEGLSDDKSLPYHYVAPLGILVSVLLILFNAKAGAIFLVADLIFNMSWYFRAKGKTQPYLTTMRVIWRDYSAAHEVLGQKLEILSEEQEKIAENLKKLKKFRMSAALAGYRGGDSGNPLSVIGDYLNMILHIDLIVFYSMVLLIRKRKNEIDELHAALGTIETMIAAASWKESFAEASCEPVFDGTESAVQIYHPLLEHPVKNSYTLEKPMLLTGSNASGKSTFLKTVAVNMLLSQCFYMACADAFHTDFHRIYTSMALRDDMAHGDSYFIAEIKAMRRILLGAAEEGAKIACFVDEVLRGTNTAERIAASTQILKYMAASDIFCFAATHDIELTALLENEYANHHFEEEVTDGDVHFNYRLLDGRATTQNAILLLSVMGYPERIVDEAKRLSERFMKEGRWQDG